MSANHIMAFVQISRQNCIGMINLSIATIIMGIIQKTVFKPYSNDASNPLMGPGRNRSILFYVCSNLCK